MKDALGYYKILQLDSTADSEAIKNAYRNLAKKWHPDSNPDDKAAEMFRQISKAHEVLGDENERIIYDILSLACDADNYPDLKEMSVANDLGEDINLKVVDLYLNNAWFSGCQRQHIQKPLSYAGACRLIREAASTNWLKGWWHYKTLFANLPAILHNLFKPVSAKETLRMLLCNMLLYAKTGQNDKAIQSGELACNYLDKTNQAVVRKFLAPLGQITKLPANWPSGKLLTIQLPYVLGGMAVVLAVIFGVWGGNFAASRQDKINYYQSVNTGYGEISDDVVVGKILNIPVNLSDESKLYHLKSKQRIMYGPSAQFDVLKTLNANTTVRLTGLTPDNVWARVMIDNGEMGFVELNNLQKGRGIEPPFGSRIVP